MGYFGPAAGARPAYARLTAGLDETMVRIVTARPGLEPVVAAMEALTPERIRAPCRSSNPAGASSTAAVERRRRPWRLALLYGGPGSVWSRLLDCQTRLPLSDARMADRDHPKGWW